MKIFSSGQIQEADKFTIANEGVSSIDLMERAASAFTNEFIRHFRPHLPVIVFCGPGNNGGDGLAICRLLKGHGYEVFAAILQITDNYSVDFRINLGRLQEMKEVPILYITEISDTPVIPENAVVIDAVFGMGLSRALNGLPSEIVKRLNKLQAVRVAVDMPSGLFADKANAEEDPIFKADYTYSFQLPKLAFMMPANEQFVGKWKILDIGLSREFIQKTESRYHYLMMDDVLPIVKERPQFSYKNMYGHTLIMAGSYGKIGAAVLTTKACLRTGVGLVTAYLPKCGYSIMQSAVPEAMVITDEHEQFLSDIPALSAFSVVGVGPGLGKSKETRTALLQLFRNRDEPLVIDADALNILAENKEYFGDLPKNSVLTPHPGEFSRLAGKADNDFEQINMLSDLSKKYNCIMLLKTSATAIALPDGTLWFNSTGNPGMATGGTGDVLTGVITGLISQRYEPAEAALLGVYLHGLAGNIAASRSGYESLTAGDVIHSLGKAWKALHKQKRMRKIKYRDTEDTNY
ncbi:MAG: NAD(P)H-hydrate dehydratase [Bacteroidia bacterium]